MKVQIKALSKDLGGLPNVIVSATYGDQEASVAAVFQINRIHGLEVLWDCTDRFHSTISDTDNTFETLLADGWVECDATDRMTSTVKGMLDALVSRIEYGIEYG